MSSKNLVEKRYSLLEMFIFSTTSTIVALIINGIVSSQINKPAVVKQDNQLITIYLNKDKDGNVTPSFTKKDN